MMIFSSEATNEVIPAIALAHKNFKVPEKDSVNYLFKNPKTGEPHRYASFNSMLIATRDALLDQGLVPHQNTYPQDVELLDKGTKVMYQMVVISRIWHISGQWLSSEVAIPMRPDKSGIISSTIAGAAIQYGRRYSYRCLLCLGDEEHEEQLFGVDRPGAPAEYIIPSQLEMIKKLIGDTQADEELFKKFMGVDDLAKIEIRDYQLAVNALHKKGEAHG